MRLLQLAILTALVTVFGHAAPITQKPDANSGVKEDPVIAAGKTPPFSPSWHYCMTACDCSRFSKDKQPEEYVGSAHLFTYG